jgi:hypothetical protein
MKRNDAAQNAKRTAGLSSKMLNDPTTTKTDRPVVAFLWAHRHGMTSSLVTAQQICNCHEQ